MQKMIARLMLDLLPLSVIAEIAADKRRQNERVARHMRRYDNKATMLDEIEEGKKFAL